MRRGKKCACLCLALLMVVLFACGYSSTDRKVYDDAGLLSDKEEAWLQDLLTEAAHRTEKDLIVVTADSAQTAGKSAMEYADDFYDEHKFGYEKENGSGVLFLIDMGNREIYISTAGKAIEEYTDSEIEWALDDIYEDVADGAYYDACKSFIDCSERYLTNENRADNGHYDEAADRFVEDATPVWKQALAPERLLMNLLAAGVISAVVVFIIGRKRKTKMTVASSTYLKNGGINLREHSDRFTHTTVITRHIPKNNGSSGGRSGGGHSSFHTSSGGHSHGGGGRKF